MTLSTLPPQFDRVSLRNKPLNLDTDNEFVIVFEDLDERSEDVDEVIDDEKVPREASDVQLFGALVVISSTSLDVNPFF